MNERVENSYEIEGEIDLTKIIVPLWENKLAIISFTIVITLLAGLVSLFLLPPVYESRLNIYVGMPKSYTTRYGDYTLPTITNEEYMDMIKHDLVLKWTLEDIKPTIDITKSELKNSINIRASQKGNDKTNYTLVISHGDLESAKLIAEALYQNYKKHIDVMVRNRTLDYYFDVYTTGLESAQLSLDYENENLKSRIKLLDDVQKYIDIEEVSSLLSSIGEVMIIESIFHPDYARLQDDIMSLRQTISDLENTVESNKKYLEDIRAEKDVISRYYEAGDIDRDKTTIINVVDRHIYRLSSVTNGVRVGPRHIENILIGAILGFVISSVSVIVWHFLRKKKKVI